MAYDSTKQRAGSIINARIEFGCVSASGDVNTHSIATQFTHVLAGLAVGSTNGATGHPILGSVCENGTVDFTISEATAGPINYVMVGW